MQLITSHDLRRHGQLYNGMIFITYLQAEALIATIWSQFNKNVHTNMHNKVNYNNCKMHAISGNGFQSPDKNVTNY